MYRSTICICTFNLEDNKTADRACSDVMGVRTEPIAGFVKMIPLKRGGLPDNNERIPQRNAEYGFQHPCDGSEHS